MEKREAEKIKNIRQIGIIGLYTNPILSAILTGMMEIPDLQKSDGMKIKLYDIHGEVSETIEIVDDIIEDIKPFVTNGNLEVLTVVEKMQDILTDCELLIVLGDYSRYLCT